MNLLSGVRLGVGVNLIPDVGMYTLNKLLVYTQPAHLAVAEGVAPADPDLPFGGHSPCAKCWNPRWDAVDEPRRQGLGAT